MLEKIVLALLLVCASSAGCAGAFAQSPEVTEVSRAPIFPGKGKEADWKKALKLYQEGVELGKSGSLGDSITDINSAITMYPFEPVFYNGLAVMYYQRHQAGDFPLAEKALRKALTMKPKSSMLWDNLGKGLFEQKQYAKAKEALSNALHCNPPAAKAKELQTNIDIIDQLLKNGGKPVAAG